MLFEDGDLLSSISTKETGGRLLDRILREHPEGWAIVAREERDLWEWDECEEVAIDVSPLRICTAVLADGTLVIREQGVERDDDPGRTEAIRT